ncbi:hypothetical protein [Azospirillum argentinense]
MIPQQRLTPSVRKGFQQLSGGGKMALARWEDPFGARSWVFLSRLAQRHSGDLVNQSNLSKYLSNVWNVYGYRMFEGPCKNKRNKRDIL